MNPKFYNAREIRNKISSAKNELIEPKEFSKIETCAAAFKNETGTRKGIFKTLITASPLKKNQYSESIPIKLTADCLFA